jgi:DtxR family transcriptional regulator, Mn-dependent transcriptional regulator
VHPSSTTAAGPAASLVTEVLELLLEADESGIVLASDDLVGRIPAPDGDVEAALELLVADTSVVSIGSGGSGGSHGDGVRLTATGRDRAVTAVRQHRLTERLLADVIGLDWWKVHHEAERWEGVISDEVERHLVDLLEDPGTCPHGNPIPGSSNRPAHPDAVRLLDATPGPVYVVRITEELESDDEALQLLERCGFIPGLHAEVKAVAPDAGEVAGTIADATLPRHVAWHTFVAAR